MMIMKESEICKEYKEAKKPGAQVAILADLNLCTKEEILKILMMNGMDVTAAGPKKKGTENDKVLKLLFATLDEIEKEIQENERKYLNVVKSLRLYGKEKAQ